MSSTSVARSTVKAMPISAPVRSAAAVSSTASPKLTEFTSRPLISSSPGTSDGVALPVMAAMPRRTLPSRALISTAALIVTALPDIDSNCGSKTL
ncbi:MAG: hypothetical protein NTU45_05035 [Planctomycetota bacterium]|nr:hypothetical protein [Planctomycetota bacterium]